MRPTLLIVLAFCLAACHAGPAVPPAPEALQAHTFEARAASLRPKVGWEAFNGPTDGMFLYIDPEPLLTNRDVESTRRTKDNAGRAAIGMTLTDEAGERFYAYTREHLGEPIAIFLDGQLLAAPTVQSALRNSLTITGGPNGLTDELADALDSIGEH
jgi:preprotein translocase subunit SecD